MKTKIGISVIFLLALVVTGCAPVAEPGKIVGAPNPVFYGDCSPHTVAFIYELPSEEGAYIGNPVDASFRLIGSDGSEVTHGLISLTTAGGAFTGTLDMNPLGPLLKGGEGSLVFYAQVYRLWPFMKGYIPYDGFHSDSTVVDVQPCPPTPTPTTTFTPTPTATPTFTPEPTKKPRCQPGPNNTCP